MTKKSILTEHSYEIQEALLMNQLPQDPVMLLSYVNTQLRDNYASLDDFCASLGVDKEVLTEKLSMIDYEYDPEKNAFV